MKTFNLTNAAPVSAPFKAGPYYPNIDFDTAYIDGTFDGGTVTLEACPIDVNANEYDANNDWFTVPDISITTKGIVQPGVKAAYFRWVLSGDSGSGNVTVRHLTNARTAGL